MENPADSENELFSILDKYMLLPPEKLPKREEIEAQYPALATEIWRCLEGMKLLKNEDSARFLLDSNMDNPSSISNSVTSSKGTSSKGGKKPETMHGAEPIGDFELIRELARGGMGVVYEAWQNSLNRLVALKVLPLASTFDERQLQRFHNEATAAAQLEHAGIVPIYAIGCERGIHFYAMKLIHGSHLGAIIRILRADSDAGLDGVTEENETVTSDVMRLYYDRRQEYFRFVARLMKQAAEALDYAHQCGVIHRDIKPANLILDMRGVLWITDFGLAQVRSDVHLTHTGEVFGTPRYMSPEQAQGHNRLSDHRVDIYSLGATFYEFMTLHPIFSETNQVQLLKQIAQDEPIQPHVWDATIPHDFETILLKCLAKTPTDRYDSAGDLAADLERFLENRPILARRPGVLEIATKWCYRYPWVPTAVFLVLFALWVGTVVNHQMILVEKSKTQDALSEAQARFEKARTAADKLVKIAEEELATDNAPDTRRARLKVLDTALILYQDFLTIDELDPETEQQLTAIKNYVQQFMELLTESNSLPPIFLLMNHDVQEDMNLSEEQKRKIGDFHRDFRQRGVLLFRDSRNFTPEERVNRMMAQIRETDAFLREVLLPEQVGRLREIQLQMQLERIFDDNVQEELRLTPKQVVAIENAFSAKNLRTPHDFQIRGGKSMASSVGHRNWGMGRQSEILASILTPEQLKKWEKMKGKPFVSRRFRHNNGRGNGSHPASNKTIKPVKEGT